MRIDVSLVPGEILAKDASRSVVVVIDVLRATSTIVTALASGCEEVIPAESIEEAIALANGYKRSDYVLGGERRGVPVEGFDLGNSPQEYDGPRVAGKKIIIATTNGTNAITEYGVARDIFVACFLNADAVMEACRAYKDSDFVLVCSGQDGRFCMEDTLCAGLLATRLAEETGAEMSDAARAASLLYQQRKESIEDELLRCDHGAYLVGIGYEQDVRYCSRQSVLSVVPKVYDRRVIRKAHGGKEE
ncbi:MAG TPA: 2-phosphosulfolactate phosphatase [Firmicutes bacterium]|jgi:2-phosphosulfolactate phosphatase|nr:2-phosphosulfolactate phosphatase [Bacillota bacterium]HAN86886.1 2-phosphosulfolactate phosphatase [Bacillota bacterium]